MKVTIGDIAKKAKVSKSTVSRYLNGGYISDKNKEKIKKIIKETGYEANFFAKRLKSNQSNLIGLIVPRMESFTANRIVSGIKSYLQDYDYDMLISISDLKVEKELKFIKKFAQQGVDAIIVLATELTDKHQELLKKIKTPILFVGQDYKDYNSMAIDDYKVGKIMADHMNDLNHKNIVYLNVNERDKAVGIKRKNGFVENIDTDDAKINIVETGFSFQKAYNSAKEVMQYQPSAIICATDNIAIGVLRYLQENKIKVPNDVSVTGFGDYEVSAVLYPALTTVKIDYLKVGVLAAKKIISLIKNEKINDDYTIDLQLVKRESVKKLDR